MRTRGFRRGLGVLLNSAFAPSQLSNLHLWLDARLGITYAQGPVSAAGTTPPAVTLTGTPASSTNTIVVTVTTPGVLGVALFSWSLNGVTQQTSQVTAASFPLSGTGTTAQFSAGTYSANNTYTSQVTVSAAADQSGLGNNCAQGTATSQPAYAATANAKGGPAIQSAYASVPTVLSGTSNLGIGTTNFTIFSVQNFLVTTGNPGPLVVGAQPTGGIALINNAGRAAHAVGVSSMVDGAIPINTWEKWTVQCAGGVTALRVNGSPQTLTPNTTAFISAPAAYSWGSAPGLGTLNGYVAAALVYATALTAPQILQVEAWLLANFGV